MTTKQTMIKNLDKKYNQMINKANKAAFNMAAASYQERANEYAYWKNVIASMSTIKFYITVIRFGVNLNF